MSIAKRRLAAGETASIEPGHGGMYRLDGGGWHWCGQGSAPHWRPTRETLVRAWIDPAAWCEGLRRGTGLDLAVEILGEPAPLVAGPAKGGVQPGLW